MVLVASRDAATLLPIIQQHVRPGSIVWSDEWRAYQRVQNLSNVIQHQTVNHYITFRNPTTGVHTQNVESYWNQVKTRFKRIKWVHESMLSSYMDEFMWRERHGSSASVTLNMLPDISAALRLTETGLEEVVVDSSALFSSVDIAKTPSYSFSVGRSYNNGCSHHAHSSHEQTL